MLDEAKIYQDQSLELKTKVISNTKFNFDLDVCDAMDNQLKEKQQKQENIFTKIVQRLNILEKTNSKRKTEFKKLSEQNKNLIIKLELEVMQLMEVTKGSIDKSLGDLEERKSSVEKKLEKKLDDVNIVIEALKSQVFYINLVVVVTVLESAFVSFGYSGGEDCE
jgi:dsDNA-specific endonuclease/ATPase MutS2